MARLKELGAFRLSAMKKPSCTQLCVLRRTQLLRHGLQDGARMRSDGL